MKMMERKSWFWVKTPGVLVALADAGVKILGSSVDSIDRAEDRERFEQLLTNCNIPRPKGHTVFDTAGALKAAADVGYPVMVRPSYVLGGRAMEIVYNDEELKHYMSSAVKASREHPVLVDHYLQGTEVESMLSATVNESADSPVLMGAYRTCRCAFRRFYRCLSAA